MFLQRYKDAQGREHMACKKRQRELGLFSLKNKVKGYFVVFRYIIAWYRENRVRFFSKVNGGRMRHDSLGQS